MAPRRPPIRQGSVLPYCYLRDDRDFALSDSLKAWRNAVALARYGPDLARMPGIASYVLSDHSLERIVDCAHFHRLQSPVDLLVETQWMEAIAMADDILGLVNAIYYPTPPPSSSEIDQDGPVSTTTT
ncbi:hypothetical protein NLI96_g1233 [Meripilus lineatus]|uniref:Uncharacterized protein n=1 Tax=Meripilus lineatus TaxID=2056292 RepID=A0AAD5VF92_9APHY|nr:hypothetical protein NLI96_g1233 [Physisporinus lineatus]